jgi:HD-GYP domain-containing protein (c-di-GMP phosphodiesterase class II)
MAIDTYNNPAAEDLLMLAEQRRSAPGRRDALTQSVAAALFLAAAIAIALIAPWHRSLSPGIAVLVVATWVAVERVKFPVADGYTFPTMLVFVPALFLLPTPVVPLIAMGAICARAVPGLLSGRHGPSVIPAAIADSWFTIGPTLVIVLAGAERFSWTHWPVYLAALAAELLVDMVAALARGSVGEGISPRVQLPLLAWIYVADASLAPLGLLIASAAVRRPGLVLIALAPMATLWLFARERQHRIDETFAVSSAYRGTALLLGDLVEADDLYTGIHSRDVVDLAVAVARTIGQDRRRQRDVEFAALLHDVGKIRLPKEVINKPGPLEEPEWELVRRHTIDGEQMLKVVGGPMAEVGQIVRACHERYDGLGYPDRLAGDQIPIEARIISACDAYSAMTTDRPYRIALMPNEALAELHRGAGRQFDADVVTAIERLLAPKHRSLLDLLATSEPLAGPGLSHTAPSRPE